MVKSLSGPASTASIPVPKARSSMQKHSKAIFIFADVVRDTDVPVTDLREQPSFGGNYGDSMSWKLGCLRCCTRAPLRCSE